MVTDHAYPRYISPSLHEVQNIDTFGFRNVALFNAQVPLAANNFKSFTLGEWDWTDSFGGSSIDDFITAIERVPTVGDVRFPSRSFSFC